MKLDDPVLTLGDMVLAVNGEVARAENVTAFPYFWQLPAATEKAAYESILRHPECLPFEYFGFPWATVIDSLRGRARKAQEILSALRSAVDESRIVSKRRVTVAQHIHALRYIELFQAAGITDLFWSHATHSLIQPEGLCIHPFPLFPAQAPTGVSLVSDSLPRKYLANFIGAYNSRIYLSNVREIIFRDIDRYDDILIMKRDTWHFDRAVYDEQIKGLNINQKQIELESYLTDEYLEAIRQSWFTLCPTGSGPNSIRIFECLSLGSIPIILTKDLRLPGPASLWNKAAIIEQDSEQGYRNAIEKARGRSDAERRDMLKFGNELFREVSPPAYARIISRETDTQNEIC